MGAGYRDANEAAQLRINTLEAQLEEKAAAAEARLAEALELERRLKRHERAQRRPRWYFTALAVSLATALAGSAVLAMHAFDTRARMLAVRSLLDIAERALEQEQTRNSQLDEEIRMLERRLAEAELRHPSHVIPADDGDDGTLVAISIGGACTFLVDDEPHGTKSSIRLRVSVGRHTVSCTPPGEAAQTMVVDVAAGKPGIASFRLN